MSSGVVDLDELLGGLIAGDNVVWSYDDAQMVARFEDAYIAEGLRRGVPCYFVTTSDPPSRVTRRLTREVFVLDARPGQPFADPVRLEQTVIEAARASLARFAIEGLDVFARRLGPTRALGLFSRICPQLFDLGSIAYWRAPTSRSEPPSSTRSARSPNASSR